MKKFKRLLPLLMAIVAVFAFGFSLVGCSSCNDDNRRLVSIDFDTSDTQLEFNVGQLFNSEGLIVIANFEDAKTKQDRISADDKNVKIDSSAYNKDAEGTYSISVSYTYNGVTQSANYDVTVKYQIGGLDVRFKSGYGEPITLSADKKTADLSSVASWIEVRHPDASTGVADLNSTPISANEYTVKVYKEQTELTDLSSLKRGAYQIWVSKYDAKRKFTYEGFILYYVVDEVQSIALSGGNTVQERSLKDKITPTWQFTVTYKSGDTAVVNKSNRYLSIPMINTNADRNAGSVTVSYNEPLPTGEAQQVTVEVGYRLTGAQVVPEMAVFNPGLLTGVDVTVETEFMNFDIIKGGITGISTNASGNVITNREADITLPTGIVIDGKSSVHVAHAWQSGGASSETDGRFIRFTAKRNFDIYIYANANGSNPGRQMSLTTLDDYVVMSSIDGYKAIDNVDVELSGSNYSRHAQSVTEVSPVGVDFSISFNQSINVFMVLVIFEEE
ncbi:MAG: hypothetical protein K2L42_01410 [Clostridia bacterium]|nr:hypothetical protein [Clostridia bacterium]